MQEPSAALDVATPERVSLSLAVVGFGHRSMAYLVDLGLQLAFWVTLYFAMTAVSARPAASLLDLSPTGLTLLCVAIFSAQWVYWTGLEVLMHGQTPGKRALSIRVVREDGAPVDFLSCAVRNLLRAVDFLPFGYALGGVLVMVTPRHQRLGDLLAGTVLTLERRFDLSRYAQGEAGEPHPTAHPLPPLSPAESELVLDFLAREQWLLPEPRARLEEKLLDRLARSLPPEERARLGASSDAARAFLRARARGAV